MSKPLTAAEARKQTADLFLRAMIIACSNKYQSRMQAVKDSGVVGAEMVDHFEARTVGLTFQDEDGNSYRLNIELADVIPAPEPAPEAA